MKINKTQRHPGVHKLKMPTAHKATAKIKVPKFKMPKLKKYGY